MSLYICIVVDVFVCLLAMFVNEEENECVGERDGKKENNMTNDDI